MIYVWHLIKYFMLFPIAIIFVVFWLPIMMLICLVLFGEDEK